MFRNGFDHTPCFKLGNTHLCELHVIPPLSKTSIIDETYIAHPYTNHMHNIMYKFKLIVLIVYVYHCI